MIGKVKIVNVNSEALLKAEVAKEQIENWHEANIYENTLWKKNMLIKSMAAKLSR